MVTPTPIVMDNSVDVSKDYFEQRNNQWNSVNLQPSLKNLPHPRQVNCKAHFSIVNGSIVLH